MTAQTENEAMMPLNMVEVTTDPITSNEKFIMRDPPAQQIFQETQKGLAKQSLMLVLPIMWPPQEANTGGIMRGAGSTSHSEDLERYSCLTTYYVELIEI